MFSFTIYLFFVNFFEPPPDGTLFSARKIFGFLSEICVKCLEKMYLYKKKFIKSGEKGGINAAACVND